MSDCWGVLRSDLMTGESARELAQITTDRKITDISRLSAKADVISDEEWDRRREEAKQARNTRRRWQLQRQAATGDGLKKSPEVMDFFGRQIQKTNREKGYQVLIEQILIKYHNPADGNGVSSDAWPTAYKETSSFLAKCAIAYHYAKEKIDQKADPSMPSFVEGDGSLTYRFRSRDCSTNQGEIRYFQTLLSKEHELPGILSAGLSDNLQKVSQFLPLSEKLTSKIERKWIFMLSFESIPHLLDSRKPKSIEEFRQLLKDALDETQFNEEHLMVDELAAMLRQNIDTMEEVALLKALVEAPSIDMRYSRLVARKQLLEDILAAREAQQAIADVALDN